MAEAVTTRREMNDINHLLDTLHKGDPVARRTSLNDPTHPVSARLGGMSVLRQVKESEARRWFHAPDVKIYR